MPVGTPDGQKSTPGPGGPVSGAGVRGSGDVIRDYEDGRLRGRGLPEAGPDLVSLDDAAEHQTADDGHHREQDYHRQSHIEIGPPLPEQGIGGAGLVELRVVETGVVKASAVAVPLSHGLRPSFIS